MTPRFLAPCKGNMEADNEDLKSQKEKFAPYDKTKEKPFLACE